MHSPKALLFDVYGTVVDVRGTLKRRAPDIADAWIEVYVENMSRSREWVNTDTQIERALSEVLGRLGKKTEDASFSSLMTIWRELDPWPDSIEGLQLLREQRLISPLSNGTIKTMAAIARHLGIRWDSILSSGAVRSVKPDPRIYQMAIYSLGLDPHEIMMVASHRYDLDGAKGCGMQTAFIDRADEPAGNGNTEPDITCKSLVELARSLP